MNKTFFIKTRLLKVLGIPLIQFAETTETVSSVNESQRLIIPVELSQEYIDEEFNI